MNAANMNQTARISETTSLRPGVSRRHVPAVTDAESAAEAIETIKSDAQSGSGGIDELHGSFDMERIAKLLDWD